MQADQRGSEQGGGAEQPEAGRDALRIEIVGEQQKETEHDHYQRITPGTHFHLLERHEADQQGHAGIATEQRAVFQADARAANDDQQHQRPAFR